VRADVPSALASRTNYNPGQAMKTPPNTWFFVISSATGVGLIIAANVWCFMILSEVNHGRAQKDRVDYFQLRGRLYEVLRIHAALYPKSSKRTQFWTLVVMGGAFLLGGFLITMALNPH
jgi:hypothetical protein